jgi:hypothetical protein
LIFVCQFRLGENTTRKDDLLLSERHEKDAIKKELMEAEEKNEELLMKVKDANQKIEHLQNTINKSVPSLLLCRFFCPYSTNPFMHTTLLMRHKKSNGTRMQ